MANNNNFEGGTEVFCGVKGSGKTTLAVDFVIKNFFNNSKNFEEQRFNYLYTNIDSFNEKFFTYKSNSVYYKFNYMKFEQHVKNMYKIKVLEEKEDADLIAYAQQHKLFKSLFIIDECHVYFDKCEKEMTWFINYNRHVGLTMFLITQNLKLLDEKMVKTIETFYNARKRSATLGSALVYDVFTHYPFAKKPYNTIKLNYKNEYTELFNSGGYVKKGNSLKLLIVKYSLVMFLALCAIIYSGYKMTTTFMPEQPQQSEEATTGTTSATLNSNNAGKKYVTLNCFYNINFLKGFCYFNNSENKDYEYKYIFNVLQILNYKYVHKKVLNDKYMPVINVKYEYFIAEQHLKDYFPSIFNNINNSAEATSESVGALSVFN